MPTRVLLLVACFALTFALLPAPVSADEFEASAPEVVEETVEGFAEADQADPDDVPGIAVPSEKVNTPIPFSTLGFTTPEDGEVWYRTSADGDRWTDWEFAPPLDSEDGPDEGTDEEAASVDLERHTDAIWVEEASWLQVAVFRGSPDDVTAHLIDADGLSLTFRERVAAAFRDAWRRPERVAHASSQPTIRTRAQWGANESWAGSPSYNSNVRAATVHHTATTNSYNQDQVAGIIRGMYSYHTQTLKWKDLGYNMVVDRFGRLWEGRRGGVDRGVIGAHAQGFNSGTFGISLIGTFETATPPAVAVSALAEAIGWKASIHGFNPTGTVTLTSAGSNKYPSGRQVTLSRVFAHRDVGLTSCPGAQLYSRLGTIRTQAASGSSPAPPPPPPPPPPPAPQPPTASITVPANNAEVAGNVTIATTATGRSASMNYVVWFINGNWIGNDYSAPYGMTWNSRTVPNGVYDLAAVAVDRDGRQTTTRVNVRVRNRVPEHQRLGGSNGRATAVAISKAAFPSSSSAQHAVLARDDVYADAIAGGPLAGKDGTMLLVHRTTLHAEVRAELERALPAGRTVYVLGGPQAISPGVANALSRWKVVRVSGANRVDTAAKVAEQVVARSGKKTAMVARASGGSAPWADGLAGGAYGAHAGVPVLLTPTDRLAPEVASVISRLGITSTTVLGGPSAVSDGVLSGLPGARRVAGSDRAGTAARIASDAALWNQRGPTPSGVLLADGFRANSWKDSLAAAPLAARRGAPVLLLNGKGVPAGTASHLKTVRAATAGTVPAWVLGGTTAVPNTIADDAFDLLR